MAINASAQRCSGVFLHNIMYYLYNVEPIRPPLGTPLNSMKNFSPCSHGGSNSSVLIFFPPADRVDAQREDSI